MSKMEKLGDREGREPLAFTPLALLLLLSPTVPAIPSQQPSEGGSCEGTGVGKSIAHCQQLSLNFAQVTFRKRTIPGPPKSSLLDIAVPPDSDARIPPPQKMATSVVNSDTLDVQPSTAVNFQDLESQDEGEERGKHFGRGFPSPRSSGRRVCPTNRLVLALMAACGILTLSVVVLGFQGVQLTVEKWGATEALQSFNQTVWIGLSGLQNKRNSTGWRLTSLEKLLMAHSDKMKKANDLFQEQLETLQQDSRWFSCELVEMRSNGTKSGCCPKDWLMFQESCYWISRATLSWESAKRDCEGKDAHLVILNSEEEKRFINQRKRPVFTWIGLTDASGDWKWVDGSVYTLNRKDWMENQPDHWYGHGLGGGEDCVHMYPSGEWNDNHCSRAFAWICEMEMKI